MSVEDSPESAPKQSRLRQFHFPNEYPIELVEQEIRSIAGHRYEDPEVDFDPALGIGTIWHIQITFSTEKPIKAVEDMSLPELELELLTQRRLIEDI